MLDAWITEREREREAQQNEMALSSVAQVQDYAVQDAICPTYKM